MTTSRLAEPSAGAGKPMHGSELADLVKELAPTVRRCIHHHLGRHEALDDAVQDALIELARALPRYRAESSLPTYARRIALRAAYRHLRREKRRRAELYIVPPQVDGRDPESVLAQRESLRRLYRCLDRLPEKRRRAFVLCCIEELPHAEAAGVEDVSVETLRGRLKHARAELERRLRHDPILGPLFEGRLS